MKRSLSCGRARVSILPSDGRRTAVLHNRGGESSLANLDVKLSLGHREREMRPSFNPAGNFINKTAFECVYRDVGKAMNVRSCKLGEELSNIAMCINGSSSGQFVPTMQSAWLGHADLDPDSDPSGEIPNENRRLVPRGDALGQRNAIRVLEAVREDAHQHVFEGFGWLPRDGKVELLVNSAVDVSQID